MTSGWRPMRHRWRLDRRRLGRSRPTHLRLQSRRRARRRGGRGGARPPFPFTFTARAENFLHGSPRSRRHRAPPAGVCGRGSRRALPRGPARPRDHRQVVAAWGKPLNIVMSGGPRAHSAAPGRRGRESISVVARCRDWPSTPSATLRSALRDGGSFEWARDTCRPRISRRSSHGR